MRCYFLMRYFTMRCYNTVSRKHILRHNIQKFHRNREYFDQYLLAEIVLGPYQVICKHICRENLEPRSIFQHLWQSYFVVDISYMALSNDNQVQ